MTDTPAEVVESTGPPRRSRRHWRRLRWCWPSCCCCSACRGGRWWSPARRGRRPWSSRARWCSSPRSPRCPLLMMLGHGRRHRDGRPRPATRCSGAAWVLFVWSVLGQLWSSVLLAGRRGGPAAVAGGRGLSSSRSWSLLSGVTPRRCGCRGSSGSTCTIPRLGRGLDGLRVAMITDTHYGPIDRARGRQRGGAGQRARRRHRVPRRRHRRRHRRQSARRRPRRWPRCGPASARVYVTGNHEYFSEAQGWLDYMASIGWDGTAQPAHRDRARRRPARRRRHRRRDRRAFGLRGHGADLDAALAGADPALPVLLLAHQPKQVARPSRAGVDLQISGHTHGGQIWPFNFLVRLDQPVVHGLSRHGDGHSCTPAAAPGSGARLFGCSRPARSRC